MVSTPVVVPREAPSSPEQYDAQYNPAWLSRRIKRRFKIAVEKTACEKLINDFIGARRKRLRYPSYQYRSPFPSVCLSSL
jgi:hypothetical protein